jgi:hypothetical protein
MSSAADDQTTAAPAPAAPAASSPAESAIDTLSKFTDTLPSTDAIKEHVGNIKGVYSGGG